MTSEVAQPGTLRDALTSVPDHRRAEGKRYPLASLLLIAIAAMLSGRRDQLGIVRWGRQLSERWPGKSAQGDKWKTCLKAANIAAEQERR